MTWLETPRELRRSMRVRSKASILLHCDTRAMRGRVVNLSVGGVYARTEPPLGLIALGGLGGLIGRLVRIELRFDACASRPFALLGRVLRVSLLTRCIAIRFDAVPEGFEDFVQDELLAAVMHDAVPRMILVDTRGTQRNSIAGAFRDAGCEVIEASTPLEAISVLGGSRFEVNLIAVADTVPETVAEELREFLLDEYPEAHMVAIGGSAVHRAPAASWLSSTNSLDDLPARVGRVMTAHGLLRRSTVST